MYITQNWSKQCRDLPLQEHQFLFGIVQGSTYRELRTLAVEQMIEIGFEGYAIGGLSVGEPEEEMLKVLDWCTPILPKDKVRYLMGVGTPSQIVKAILKGIDIFDCVLPTRVARHGMAYTSTGTVQIKAAYHKESFNKPLDENCTCYTCRTFSRAYLRHLCKSKEINSMLLLTLHNLHFYLELMKKIRELIKKSSFVEFAKDFINKQEMQ